jgi:hypothetical protein
MSDMLAIQSVNMEIIIISIEDRGCGRPKKMGNRIGHNSQNVPAGNK